MLSVRLVEAAVSSGVEQPYIMGGKQGPTTLHPFLWLYGAGLRSNQKMVSYPHDSLVIIATVAHLLWMVTSVASGTTAK